MKRTLTLFVSLFLLGILTSAPYHGAQMTFSQPDGSSVEVLLFGDEYYLQAESPDGYTLIRDEHNWICYATTSETGELTSTGEKYTGAIRLKSSKLLKKHLSAHTAIIQDTQHNNRNALEGIQHKAALIPSAETAVKGKYLGLTILVDFSDAPSKVDVAKIDSLCNGKNFTVNNNYGSLNKYYKDISFGLVDYQNTVIGIFRAPKTYDEYDNMPYGNGAKELITAALKWVDEQGFDFNTLSLTSENRIKALNIVLSGNPQGWAKGMWYHKGWHGGDAGDGVKTSYYNLSPSNPPLKIGTICHENGHMVCGWPDTYKYSGAEDGIGRWDLMCSASGGYPGPPNPQFRNQVGWGEIIDVLDEGTFSSAKNDATTYKVTNPQDDGEFYLIENRIKEGLNSDIPAEGLTIWHIDKRYDTQKNADTEKQKILIENAFGLPKYKYLAPFDGGFANEFSPNTWPSSNWHFDKSELSIDSISALGDTMYFRVLFGKNKLIKKDSWKVLDAETLSSKGEWHYMIDNKVGTEYSYASRQDRDNHIILDMGASWQLDKLKYLPKYENNSQVIKHYAIYLSEDSATWGEAITHGTLDKNGQPKTIAVNASGRYLKLEALSDSIIPLTLQIAELYAYGELAAHSIPASITSTSPEHNEAWVNTVKVMEWEAAIGADSYKVYFGTTAELTEDDLLESTKLLKSKVQLLQKATTYYWRIDAINENGINVGNTNVFSTISENIAKGKGVSTSSNYNTSYIANKLTDGDNNSNESRWLSAKGATYPHWVEVNLGSQYRVNVYRIFTGWDGYNKPLNDFLLQYQENGQWITADSIVNNKDAEFTATLPGFVTDKVRLYITKSTEDMVRMYELELYGQAVKTSVINEKQLEKFSISPNPAKSYITLDGVKQGKVYSIYSLSGQCLQRGHIQSPKIDISQLNSGIYLLHISQYEAVRLIKE